MWQLEGLYSACNAIMKQRSGTETSQQALLAVKLLAAAVCSYTAACLTTATKEPCCCQYWTWQITTIIVPTQVREVLLLFLLFVAAAESAVQLLLLPLVLLTNLPAPRPGAESAWCLSYWRMQHGSARLTDLLPCVQSITSSCSAGAKSAVCSQLQQQ